MRIIKHLVNDLYKYILKLSSANQVIPPLMCSLLDQVPDLKETQPGRIQLYSAGLAEQSVPEPVVEVSCILMSSLVFTLSGTLLLLGEHDIHVMTLIVTANSPHNHSQELTCKFFLCSREMYTID